MLPKRKREIAPLNNRSQEGVATLVHPGDAVAAPVLLSCISQPLVRSLIVQGEVMPNLWLSAPLSVLQVHGGPPPPPVLARHKLLASGGLLVVAVAGHQRPHVGTGVAGYLVVALEDKAAGARWRLQARARSLLQVVGL